MTPNELLATFELKPMCCWMKSGAGGRIPLIIGRGLTAKHASLGLPHTELFSVRRNRLEKAAAVSTGSEDGRPCLGGGRYPSGEYCEPKMTSVGSGHHRAGMTRDELKDRPVSVSLRSGDAVFLPHTAAYPKPVDVNTHHTLPDFIMNRGGVFALRPGTVLSTLAEPYAAAGYRRYRW